MSNNELEKLFRGEIEENVDKGRDIADKVQKDSKDLISRIGRLTDEPGYVFRGGRWMRVTPATPGLTPQERLQAGYRPGTWSKIKATVRSWFP